MTPWLVHELRNLGLEVVCLDARHARAALKMQINKTDQNDAEGLAQIVRTGWYRSVQVPCAQKSTRTMAFERRRDCPTTSGGCSKRSAFYLARCGDCHSIGRLKV